MAAFVITAGNLSGAEMANTFVKSLPSIFRFMARNPAPFIAKITKRGSVSMLFSGKPK